MSYKHVSDWRRRTKIALIQYKGGKCGRCGYDKLDYPRVFDFHHRDPKSKDFNPSCKNWSFARLKQEVDKCDLLCRNCHGELHEELDARPNNRTSCAVKKLRKCDQCEQFFSHKREDQRYCSPNCVAEAKAKRKRKCRNCGNEFRPNTKLQSYCSYDCHDLARRKIKWLSKEELQELVWQKPTSQLAVDLNVSDKAISKWCKAYDISKPPRGYWAKSRRVAESG